MPNFKSDLAVEISRKLSEDERTEGAGIEAIDDGAGVITLSGVVASNDIVEAAKEIATEQPDVTTVVSELKVRPEDTTLWPFVRRTR